MIGLVLASRAPQTILNLGGLQIPFPQNVGDIRTLTVEGTMIQSGTFLPFKFEFLDYTVPLGKLTLIGQSLSVASKDAFQLGHAADTSGTNFIPIIGASIFSQGGTQVAILSLLTPVKTGRVIGVLAVKSNMNIAATLYCQEVFDSTLEEQPTELIP